MLEILILIVLCRNIAAKARAKGRSGGGFGFLLVVLWICGEVGGGIVGLVAATALGGGDDGPEILLILGGMLGGAILGAVIAFAIVGSIAPATPAGRYDDDDDYDDRPRRARPRDDRW